MVMRAFRRCFVGCKLAETLSLFPEPEPELKLELARRLRALAASGIYLGSSSWKYEGWLDTIYHRQRYFSKGRFSKKRFDEECLVEYAETFPIVCGDFAFYQFPARAFWQKLFAQAPRGFLFAFKAPEEITRLRFAGHPRYGARAGLVNPNFLNAEMITTQFLDLLAGYRERVPLIVLEFGAFPRGAFANAQRFAQVLGAFLAALPKTFRYAVEIRNAELFAPEYLAVLREYGVAHLFNAWTEMPALDEQMALAEAFTADFTAARGLLVPGREYEESRALFYPYRELREPNERVRAALRELLVRGKLRAEPTYVFVNNRLEGFAPGTILGVTEGW